MRLRVATALVIITTITTIAATAIFVANAVPYFFLLDDIIITRAAASRSTWQLFSAPLFNFYRPVTDLWLKALYAVFGWEYPAAFITASMALHGACALLVRVLARMGGLGRAASTFAGLLFLLSPWATEPVLWVAANCDSLPTLGLLGCVVAALWLVRDARGDVSSPFPWTPFCLGVGAALWALLAKEIGVLAPVLVFLAVACVRGPRALIERRAALYYLIAIAIATAAYLVVREQILPGLGGGYGTLSALFGRGSIAHNLRTFAIVLLEVPLPTGLSGAGAWMVRIAVAVFAFGCAGLLVLGLLSRWRLGVLCVAAALASIAPVLWATLVPGNTSGNRFLYLPGVWFAILVAAGLERVPGRARAIAAALILSVAAASLYYQARIWRDASRLSRAAIEQLRPYAGSTAPLFISNLPGLYADGPYVLNTVAVTSYFPGSFPPVEANMMGLKFDRGATIFAFWLNGHRPARPDERPVTLDLPVWTAESRPYGEIEEPGPGATVSQPFTIRGWAIDAGAREGTGVETVRVYAYPLPGSEQDATPLGEAAHGDPRPDVSRRFGARFLNSGFHLEASGLRPGPYRVVVHTRRTLARGADVPLSVDIVVR
jgi:hypothetical protein